MKKKLTICVLSLMISMLAAACGNVTASPGSIAPAGTDNRTEASAFVSDDTASFKSTVDEPVPDTDETEADVDKPAESEEEPMKEAAVLLYQGHASMRISTPEGKTIYVDPFMGEGYDLPADLILETHGHYDHTQDSLIKTKNDGCEKITWKESIKNGEHQTFDLGYVTVEAVEAGYNKNHNAKECVGFILTFSNGATLYLSGDTSTTPQMAELADRNLDYAFFCCDGIYNMDMSEAIDCANTVGAKHSIPYHMVPGNNSNGFDKEVAERFDVEGRIILSPGEELVLE